MDDWTLLQEYATRKSETAFEALVRRYLDLVHSSALRQVDGADLADDITQAVFLVLARKAGSLRRGTILAGWLFRTTRFVASKVIRGEQRRQWHEQKAAEMQPNIPPSDPWEQLAPLLDAAIDGLSGSDRNAVLLRFFQRKSFQQVGLILGVSEEAAKKRVARAVDKLRLSFRKRGLVISSTALAGILSNQAIQAAPIGLSATIASAAVLPVTSLSAPLVSLVKQALQAMAWAKFKAAASWGIAVFCIVVLTNWFINKSPQSANRIAVNMTRSTATGARKAGVLVSAPARSTRNAGPSGVVLKPDGSPASGAQVMLSGVGFGAQMATSGNLYQNRSDAATRTITDEFGRFYFKPTPNALFVMVAHESGSAVASMDEFAVAPVVLRLWGRIEGILKIGRQPGASRFVAVSSGGAFDVPSPHIPFQYRAKTDENGHFGFDHLPPGKRTVFRENFLSEDRVTATNGRPSHELDVEVKPGETTQVVLGGTGRRVIGRLVANPENLSIDWTANMQVLIRQRPDWPEIKQEDFSDELSFFQAFNARSLAEDKYYPKFIRDGSFEIEDVAPGIYRLEIKITEAFPGTQNLDLNQRGKIIGTMTQTISVPEVPDRDSDEQLDLGSLSLNLREQGNE